MKHIRPSEVSKEDADRPASGYFGRPEGGVIGQVVDEVLGTLDLFGYFGVECGGESLVHFDRVN